jgi:DNA recombination protein Rad52
MTGFAPKQVRALRRKLARQHVQSRQLDGRSIDYIEGWFAVAQANAIFGFEGWDREMIHFEKLYERARGESLCCGYVARVRIRVRAGETIIVREGTGWGSASATNPCEAHERALKAAETDATKRALATFGNRFGLGLYDKEQAGVGPKKGPSISGYVLFEPNGTPLAENLSPESFCSGFRQLIEGIQKREELEALKLANQDVIARLRTEVPQLKTARGVHYADILERLVKDRLEALKAPPQTNGVSITLPSLGSLRPSRITQGPRIDKSLLPIGIERRLRDHGHLQFVGSCTCLVCGRLPSHAHHLTFAQKRGLSMKVSDEFTVPLCAVHHDELHRSGSEQAWWQAKGIDPETFAKDLWKQSRTSPSLSESGRKALPSPTVLLTAEAAP